MTFERGLYLLFAITLVLLFAALYMVVLGEITQNPSLDAIGSVFGEIGANLTAVLAAILIFAVCLEEFRYMYGRGP